MLRRKHSYTFPWPWIRQWFLRYGTKRTSNQIKKIDKVDIRIKYFFCSKAYHQEVKRKNLKFVWKYKRPWIAKAILRKKNRAGGIGFLTSDYTTKLLLTNSMVLAQTELYNPMEQDRKPRNKITHLWPINLRQRRKGYTVDKGQSLQ